MSGRKLGLYSRKVQNRFRYMVYTIHFERIEDSTAQLVSDKFLVTG